MKGFENLDRVEQQQPLNYPVYVSLLASNSDGTIDEKEKQEALHLTHLKTFSGDALLRDYFEQAEQQFSASLAQLDEGLPKEKFAREAALKSELKKIEGVLTKVDERYSRALHKSMRSYAQHVSHAHRNVLEWFLIPFYIKGLTD